MADYVGQQLGNYRLLRLLGEGSFAAVYLGEHLYLERPAAIKILHVDMESKTHEAFLREARTIADNGSFTRLRFSERAGGRICTPIALPTAPAAINKGVPSRKKSPSL